jgi:hypothetical protein
MTDRQAGNESAAIELLQAQLRGIRDFLSGQPRELPYRGSTGQAKESTLNVAWAMGYDSVEATEVFTLLVRRADLRARLHQQIAQWNERSAKLNWGAVHDDDLSDDEHERWFGEADALKACAADLLAVLTEPEEKK